MNNLQKKAQSSKLNITKQKKDKVISVNRVSTFKVLSLALDRGSDNRLQELLEKVGSLSQRRVKASHLVRALIYLGKQSSDDKLLKALKETAV